MTKFLNISTDNTLGGNSPSNELVASQKAIKEYVDNNSGSIATGITNKNTEAGATNPIYDWVGTLAEYNAQDIENQHPDWICYITDDVSGGASVYTKAQVDTIASGKANTALDNLTSAGKSFITHAGMPDMSAGVQLNGLDSYQQITEDGWLHISSSGDGNWTDVGVYYSVNGSTHIMQFTCATLYGNQMFLPVPKNIYIKRYNSKTTQIVFYPCIKG